MKKLMFAAAVAAGLAAFGEGGIESQNTVGFNTKAVEAAKFYILGVQFEATDGTADINKLVSGFTGESQEENENFTATAPQIQIPNAAGRYDVYYYLVDGWYDNGTEDGAFKPGWCDQNGVIAGEEEADLDGEITTGVGMWVKDVQNSETFQQAGQVPGDSSVAVSAPANFTLRTNPFPVAFNLNDATKVTCANLTAGDIDDDDFASKASQIQVPNAAGRYDVYYYLSNGWYDNGTEDGDFKPGWCDQNGVIAGEAEADLDGNIPAGQGFWTKGVGGSFTMTFTK